MFGKLGCLKSDLTKPHLLLKAYLTPAMPTPPPSVKYRASVKRWPMMLNDQIGCCAIACPGHMIEQWTSCNGKPVVPSDAQILSAYEAVGGYQPDDPKNPQTNATDVGCDPMSVLAYWQNTGIAGHKIGGSARVDTTNANEVKLAIYLFGNLYLGMDLPLSAQGQGTTWIVDTSNPDADAAGSWGGHAVPAVGYDQTDLVPFISWGAIYLMSFAFLAQYCMEAWAVFSTDWLNGKGVCPAGFNKAQLLTDLANLK